MEDKIITQISFRALMKIVVAVTFVIGVVAGIVSFVVSLFGAPVTTGFGASQLIGIRAGTVNLIVFPVLFSLVGFIYTIISFFPFNLILKMTKGMKIRAKWLS